MGLTSIQTALVQGNLDHALGLFVAGDESLADLLRYLNNDNRVIWLWMLAEVEQLNATHAPAVAEAVRDAHGLRHLWPKLQELLEYMPLPLFDGEASRAAYDAMGDTVTVYRGDYPEWEQMLWAPSWTLSRERAEWFAGGRSGGIVRTLHVQRDDVLGVLFERGEQEVLIDEPVKF